MGNVLEADCAAGNAYVKKTIAFPTGGWYVQADVLIPSSTLTAILANTSSGSQNTAPFIDLLASGSSTADIYGGNGAGDSSGLTSPIALRAIMGSGDAAAAFTADAWHTFVLHYDGTTVHVTLDGTSLDANLSGALGSGDPTELRVGGPFASSVGTFVGQVYYIDNVKVGTTLGGTDLFSDDFEGDLSGWDATVGAASITADPGPAASEGDGGADASTFGGPVRVGVAFNDAALVAAPTWTYLTDTDNLVAAYSIDRGRQFEFDKTDAGTATVSVFDKTGLLDPTNSAGPYYGLLEPLLQIKIELWDPVALTYHTRFRGWIDEFTYVVDPSTHQDGAGDTVGLTRLEIGCVDIFTILTNIEMQPDGSFGDTPPTTPVDSSGNIFFDNAGAQSRAIQVLGNAGIPTAFYVIFTLNVNMQESVYSPSSNVLQVLQDVGDAEFPTVSNVYTDRLGRLAIHGRLAKFDPDGVAAGASAGAWLFTRWQAGDGKAVAASPTDTAQIRSLSYNRGRAHVINSALCTPNGIDDTNKTTVTGVDIADQYYDDPTSISQFGYQSWSAENLLLGAPTGDILTGADAGTLTGNSALDECLAFATYIVENYKTPRNRISEISFRSMNPTWVGAAATWALLCQADISDVVEVTVRGPGDSPTGYIFNAEEFFIEGMHEEASPATGQYANVTLSLDLSPKAYFPLGGDSGLS